MSTLVQSPLSAARPAPLDGILAQLDGSLGASRRLRYPRLVLYLIVLISLAGVGWAAWAPVDRIVRTQGRVVPSQKAQLIQHLEGGIVSRVFVHEGDVVAKAANLIAISDLSASSARGDKRAQINGLLARAARLVGRGQWLAALCAAGRDQSGGPRSDQRKRCLRRAARPSA